MVAGSEAGQDGDSVPRGDHGFDDAVIEESLAHPGGCPVDHLDLSNDPVERKSQLRADPYYVGEVFRRERRLRAERVPLGERNVERLAHQRHHREPALPPGGQDARRLGEHDVEVGCEVGEVGQQRVLVGAGERQARHAGDGGEQSGQQHLTAGGKCGQRHFAARRPLEVRPDRVCPFQRNRDIGGSLGERAARTGEPDATARPLGERDTSLPLEYLQLLGYGGNGAAGGPRHGRNAAPFGKLSKQFQAADIHVASLHNHLRYIRLCFSLRGCGLYPYLLGDRNDHRIRRRGGPRHSRYHRHHRHDRKRRVPPHPDSPRLARASARRAPAGVRHLRARDVVHSSFLCPAVGLKRASSLAGPLPILKTKGNRPGTVTEGRFGTDSARISFVFGEGAK